MGRYLYYQQDSNGKIIYRDKMGNGDYLYTNPYGRWAVSRTWHENTFINFLYLVATISFRYYNL